MTATQGIVSGKFGLSAEQIRAEMSKRLTMALPSMFPAPDGELLHPMEEVRLFEGIQDRVTRRRDQARVAYRPGPSEDDDHVSGSSPRSGMGVV